MLMCCADATRKLASLLGREPQLRYGLLPLLLGQLQVPAEFHYYVSALNTLSYTIDYYGPLADCRTSVTLGRQFQLISPEFAPVDANAGARSPRSWARVVAASNAVQRQNVYAKHHNERVFSVLKSVANKDLPDDPQRWWDWWLEENERVVNKYKPILYEDVQNLIVAHECFVAGTPVWTETGPKPIERVVTGERVLSQDPETGELAYRFVLQTTLRPSSKTVRIRVANDEIWSTLGHLFWVSGQGWKMAKHLAAGDLIHAVDGPRPVTAVAVGPTTEAHNLVVDGFNTYFVGEFPLLVHDNMPRRLTPTRVPGLNAKATHVEGVGVEK